MIDRAVHMTSSRRPRGLATAVIFSTILSAGGPGDGVSQEVEVLVGTRPAAASAPGIRVVARVGIDPHGTIYEPVQPLTADEVLSVQRALSSAGFDPGPLDGRIGPRVRGAITRFQTSNGMPTCGCLDGPTLQALGLRLRVMQTTVGPAGDRPHVEILAPARPSRPATNGRPVAPPPDTVSAAPGAPYLPVWGILPAGPGRPILGVGPPALSGRTIAAPTARRLVRVSPPPPNRPPR